MTKVVSPSEIVPMTRGQISKALDVLGDALRKSGLPCHPTQEVLEQHGAALADAYVVSLRKYVEELCDMFSRLVKVNRTRTPQEALDATGRKQILNCTAVNSMPKGDSDEVEIVFFKLKLPEDKGCIISNDDLEKEYDLRGLKPADPFSLAGLHEVDPAFADEKPNGTMWKDADGCWCYMLFPRWSGKRHVIVIQSGNGWDDSWWFAGLRK